MNANNKTVLLFIFIWFANHTIAQSFHDIYVPNKAIVSDIPFELLTEVKSFDEFIGRYNGELNAFGENIDYENINISADARTELRSKIIGSLSTPELQNNKVERLISFSKEAAKGPNLDFSTTKFQAVIPIEGDFKNDKIKAELILAIESLSDNRYRWYIKDVNFNEEKVRLNRSKIVPDLCTDVFIPPNAHDIGFIALKRIFSGEELLQNHIKFSNINLEKLNYLLNKHWKPNFFNYYFLVQLTEKIKFEISPEYKISRIL